MQLTHAMRDKWTHWELNPGPSACEADVIPLHHVPHDAMVCQQYPDTTSTEHHLLPFFPFANPLPNLMFNALRLCPNWKKEQHLVDKLGEVEVLLTGRVKEVLMLRDALPRLDKVEAEATRICDGHACHA